MKLDAESYLKTGSNELRVLEYRAAGMAFGINILKVAKIVNNEQNQLRMPESHRAIGGIFRDMDRVVPVIDLAVFLGLAESSRAYPKIIITEFFGMLLGFYVERVDWIHHFNWANVVDPKDVFSDITHKYLIGIVRPTEERMVQLLDYENILLDLCPHLCTEQHESVGELNPQMQGKRVLVVEDSPAVRAMLVSELSDRGLSVTESNDGREAWQAFQKDNFDLVVTDVEMPQMDGLALTLQIRQSNRPNTPVIVYSSIGDIGMKARASFLKADAHITKLNLELLLQSAERLMRGERPSAEATSFGVVAEAEELVTAG